MIVMFDTSANLDVCEKEIGYPAEELFTPLTRFTPKRPEGRFAIDNGAFTRFDAKGFLSLLEREKPRRELCRFIAVPDVVGSARRTLESFHHWKNQLGQWPLALVCQDGQEALPIPWDEIDAVFIGGSTEWKLSRYAVECIKTAQLLGKWVHVGRVNTPTRFDRFEKLGVDSIDGSGISRFTYMREDIRDYQPNPQLFEVV